MNITRNQFGTLEDLFNYYNEGLFDNKLPGCIVNLSRHKGAHGFFAPEHWKDVASGELTHEISLNPDTMNRPDRAWHSTLVHEMCHLWQEVHGKAPRRCYHDKQFAAKMESVGLMPSTTGEHGGKRTGQSMTHYVIEGGAFDLAFVAISSDDLLAIKLPYTPTKKINTPAAIALIASLVSGSNSGDGDENSEPTDETPIGKPSRSGVKVTYECSCGNKVWGKPDLDISCNICNSSFKAQ